MNKISKTDMDLLDFPLVLTDFLNCLPECVQYMRKVSM